MVDPVLVDVVIYFPDDRVIRIKSVLEALNLNAISYGGMKSPNDKYPIPIGASYTLSARVSDWKEGKDGRPARSEAPAPSPAAPKRDIGKARRAARRERSRARRRAAAQVHGDGSA